MTPYTDIYERFLRRIGDDGKWIINAPQSQIESDLRGLLELALSRTGSRPPEALSNNPAMDEFSQTLPDEFVQILTSWMRYEWLNRQAYSWEVLTQRAENRDTSSKSQAGHLTALVTALEKLKLDIRGEEDRYSRFRNGKAVKWL